MTSLADDPFGFLAQYGQLAVMVWLVIEVKLLKFKVKNLAVERGA